MMREKSAHRVIDFSLRFVRNDGKHLWQKRCKPSPKILYVNFLLSCKVVFTPH